MTAPATAPAAALNAPATTGAAAGDLPPAPGKKFQPGVHIVWETPAVWVAATVVLREGLLEFFACFPGKEHESILRIDAAAVHVYQALGLIGRTPGRPPRWEELQNRFEPAEGDFIALRVLHAGVESAAAAWLLEAEYMCPPPAEPWVFAGSRPTAAGDLAAQQSGAGAALVDFGDSLLSLSRSASSDNSALWAVAHTARIPPTGTRVWVVLTPPAAEDAALTLDFRGDLRRDGAWAARPALIAWLRSQLQCSPSRAFKIDARRALPCDVIALQEELRRAGVDLARIEIVR